MEAFVLVVQLMRDGPVVMFPVSDCRESIQWIREGWRWSGRSKVDDVNGPVYVCYPAVLPVLRASR